MKYKIKKITFILTLFMLLFVCINPMKTNAKGDETNSEETKTAKVEVKDGKVVLNSGFDNQDDAFAHVIDKYKILITFFAAIGAITMVGIFIYTFIKLGASSGNPMERQKCITGLIITGIATALLGSTALFVGLFYGAFK